MIRKCAIAVELVAKRRVDAVLLDVGLTDGPSFALAWYLADAGYRSPLQQHVDRMKFHVTFETVPSSASR
jgi:hypothetical protein